MPFVWGPPSSASSTASPTTPVGRPICRARLPRHSWRTPRSSWSDHRTSARWTCWRRSSAEQGRHEMDLKWQVVVFDAADLAAESDFWAGVRAGTVDAEGDWRMGMGDGAPRSGVQLAPNHVARDWPDGTPEQQIHMDLWVDDFPTAHGQVMALGAKVLKPAEDSGGPDT